jgi:hypothetical protein
MYVRLFALLAPERLDGLYSCSVFTSLPVIRPWPVNITVPYGHFIWGPKRNLAFVLENSSHDLDCVLVIYGDRLNK